MDLAKQFTDILEELKAFHRNLRKDSVVKRKDITVIKRKLDTLDDLGNSYKKLKDLYNTLGYDSKYRVEIRNNADEIAKYFGSIRTILKERVQLSHGEQAESSQNTEKYLDNMAEKFELKTAASLLPVMDGSEKVTKELIDAIDLYDAMLDMPGKKTINHICFEKVLTFKCKN